MSEQEKQDVVGDVTEEETWHQIIKDLVKPTRSSDFIERRCLWVGMVGLRVERRDQIWFLFELEFSDFAEGRDFAVGYEGKGDICAGLVVKNSPANTEDVGSIPEL